MSTPNLSSRDENDDVRRVAGEIAHRLGALGVGLTGAEQPEELLAIMDAIEAFERAVQARGGNLMVDEGPGGRTTEPDDRHFALPVRGDDETVAAYIERLARATDEVRRHPNRAD